MADRVVITHRVPMRGLEALEARFEVVAPQEAAFTQEELMALAPDAVAVISVGMVNEAFVRAAPRLRVVSNYGAGYDRVDVAALTAVGVPLTVLTDEVAVPTAELTLALLLAASRRVGELNQLLRTGAPEDAFGIGKRMGHSLAGRTLGIVGMGHIGRRVRDLARAFGMRVVYSNRNRLAPALEDGAEYLPLEALVAQADAVTLHCPLNAQTHGLLSASLIARMKPDAVLINTSRGAVADTEALIDALAHGRIAGAGLDVYPDEPHVPAALLALPNVVLTPHVGSNTEEARALMGAQVARNILCVLDGQRPAHVVNPEVFARA